MLARALLYEEEVPSLAMEVSLEVRRHGRCGRVRGGWHEQRDARTVGDTKIGQNE